MVFNNILQNKQPPGKAQMEESHDNSDKQRDKNNLLCNESEGFFMIVNCEIIQEAGINKGDTILVRKSLEPLNGNVVVASVSGDVVIRFYQKVQAKIFLSGDAGKVCPMQIEPGFEDFKIIGVVTFVVKKVS